MKKLVLVAAVLGLLATPSWGQNILSRMKEKAKETVGNTVGNIINGQNRNENETEEAEETAARPAQGWTCPDCGHAGNSGKFCEECGAKQPGGAPATWDCPACGHKANTGKFCADCGAKKPEAGSAAPAKKEVESAYAKSDFVPGDEIFFEDTFENEQLGEFPSQWDLMDGYAEVGSFAGRKVLAFTDDGFGTVTPLMKEQRAFLPEVFTLEFDVFVGGMTEGDGDGALELVFSNSELIGWNSGECGLISFWYREDGGSTIRWSITKPDANSDTQGQKDLGFNEGLSDYNGKDNPLKMEDWNHFAFSFNQRAFKGYINGMRVINIPSAMAPRSFWFHHSGAYKYGGVSNVRLAKGAVPLYDRLASDGKIVTYAITFDTGKATIKPESFVGRGRGYI